MENKSLKKKTKVKYLTFHIDKLDLIKTYLEDMAAKGWMLKKVNPVGKCVFEESEPKTLRFALSIYEGHKTFQVTSDDKHDEYVEYCISAGWNHIGYIGMMDIFYTEDNNAPELHTEESTKFKSICDKKKSQRVAMPLVMLVIMFPNLLIQGFFAANIGLTMDFSIIYSLLLVLGAAVSMVYGIVRFYIWKNKAEKEIENGGKVLPEGNIKSIDALKGFARILFSCLFIGLVPAVCSKFFYSEFANMYKIYIFVIIAMLILIVFCFALAEYAERVKLNAFIYSLCSILVIPGMFVSAQTNFIEKTSKYLMINEGESKFTPSFNINDTQVLLGDYEEESVFSEVTGKFLILKEEYELTGFKCDVPFDENGEYDDEFYPLSARRPLPLRWEMNCAPNMTKLLDNGRIM
ncbi:MAG: DUF2812 domain-containing protein [Lachnospiraceae bacterium]|nr:DUF2812 domain-containing protein [Lachnospiraceae bacterium]